jgi:hypothetical protein
MAGDNWELPKPIFRTSDGVVILARPGEPESFVEPDTLSPDIEENLSALYLPPDITPSDEQPFVPKVEVEEQPYISEQLTAERIVNVLPGSAETTKKQGRSYLGILVVLFVVLTILVAILYYIFLMRQPADTTF